MSELVVQNTEIASTTLFGTDSPSEVVERASKVARTLEQVVRTQNLVVRIGQSEHVRVEGWTFLGSMLGVFPVVEWTRPVMRDDEQVGWEARVEARTRSGEVVGAAEAECLTDERTWKGRDDYARRSMAQTRAVSKALRLPLGFVMQLAGFSPTPAEEMPVIEQDRGRGPTVGDAAAAPAPNRGVSPASLGAEPAPLPDDSAEGTPFGYDVDGPVEPAGAHKDKVPTAAMLKKLNVLVGKLRPDHLSTLQLWQSMGRDPADHPDSTDSEGVLHWSPLRDSLTFSEALQLIDRLDKYAAEKLAA